MLILFDSGCMIVNNKITERDKIELSSYWAYQDYTIPKDFNFNGKKFKAHRNH